MRGCRMCGKSIPRGRQLRRCEFTCAPAHLKDIRKLRDKKKADSFIGPRWPRGGLAKRRKWIALGLAAKKAAPKNSPDLAAPFMKRMKFTGTSTMVITYFGRPLVIPGRSFR